MVQGAPITGDELLRGDLHLTAITEAPGQAQEPQRHPAEHVAAA